MNYPKFINSHCKRLTFLVSDLLLKGLIVLVFFLPKVASGQLISKTDLEILSPEASALMKYGDIPIGSNTGIPDISIPIHTVKEGELELPISISYHAGGIRVSDISSRVGLGWTLNAGGMISRRIFGTADEANTEFPGFHWHGHYSDYGYSSYYDNSEDEYPNSFWGILDPADNDLVYGISNGYIDGQPDIYQFSFGKYSGKFYFNDDRTPVFFEDQGIKVELACENDEDPRYTDCKEGFTEWILTTPDGVRYYFGEKRGAPRASELSTAISYVDAPISDVSSLSARSFFPTYTLISIGSANLTESTLSKAKSSWYLTKIESPQVAEDGTRRSIFLTYEEEDYSYISYSGVLGVVGNLTPVRTIFRGVRLAKISTSHNGEVVDFVSNTIREDLGGIHSADESDPLFNVINNSESQSTSPAMALDRIDFYNENGYSKYCKSWTFHKDYFESTIEAPDLFNFQNYPYNYTAGEKRLKLNGISIDDCSGSVNGGGILI